MKRLFDFLSSLALLIVVSPLLLPLMLILKLTGEGKIFYIQERVAQGGKSFGLIKFATMLENSPNMSGGDVTSGNDPRVLPVGRFLRKTKINELPQLINILKGDISVVGPRPMTPRNFAYYSQEIQDQIRDLKPGLTGIGSIVFRDEEAVLARSSKPHLECFKDDIAPYKGSLEVWYSKNQSFFLDLQLIFLTAWAIVVPSTQLHFKLYKDLPKNEELMGKQ